MIRYANVNGELREPSSGLKGICPGCLKGVIAKCCLIKIHHWAHLRKVDCDAWWEPMTQWHVNWQNKFFPEWREVNFRNHQTGEFHRADIHTSTGLTIEFQHSSLSNEELQSRNDFYKKIIWVVNAQRFKGEFIFTNPIPDPHSPILDKFNFAVDPDGLSKFAHFFLKEGNRDPRRSARVFSLHDVELKSLAEGFEKSPKLYWLFNWKYKSRSWLRSSAPVFFDFGDEFLYWIKKREQWPVPLCYLQIVQKKDFLEKYTKKIS